MLSEGVDFDKTPGQKSYSPSLLALPSLQDNIDRCIIVWDEIYNNNNTLYLNTERDYKRLSHAPFWAI